MNLLEGIASGIQVMASHKMRTLLTLLGVMIGVAAVIGMISIGDGARTIIMEDSEKIGGATMIRFRRSRHIRKGNRWVHNDSEEYFTYDDALAIEEQVSGVRNVIPSVPIRHGGRITAGAGLDTREVYAGYQGEARFLESAVRAEVDAIGIEAGGTLASPEVSLPREGRRLSCRRFLLQQEPPEGRYRRHHSPPCAGV